MWRKKKLKKFVIFFGPFVPNMCLLLCVMRGYANKERGAERTVALESGVLCDITKQILF
jgi:hypothetical protein